MYFPALLNDDTVSGFTRFSIRHIERPFLNWKDSWIPPSPESMNKRIAHYVDTYLNVPGGDVSIPLIWDAVQKGGNPGLVVDKTDAAGRKTGTEPLIVKAARSGKFFLVQALAAAGADIDAKDSDGNSALLAGAKGGFLEIVSYLADRGADPRNAAQEAETRGFGAVAKYLKAAEGFNTAAASGQSRKSSEAGAKPAPKGITCACG